MLEFFKKIVLQRNKLNSIGFTALSENRVNASTLYFQKDSSECFAVVIVRDKKEYKQQMARVEMLPRDYQFVFSACGANYI